MFNFNSYIFSLITTIVASIVSCMGLVTNNNILLLAATLMATTSDTIYLIIKEYINNKKISILGLLIYLFIILCVPLLISILIGYILGYYEYNKKDRVSYNILSNEVIEMLEFHPFNFIGLIFISLLCSCFLPYCIKTQNIKLSVSISIILAFVTPLTIIGLLIGSNQYTQHNYNIKDYIIPITILCSNILGISSILFISIKYLNF